MAAWRRFSVFMAELSPESMTRYSGSGVRSRWRRPWQRCIHEAQLRQASRKFHAERT